jgi:hypothetical protein
MPIALVYFAHSVLNQRTPPDNLDKGGQFLSTYDPKQVLADYAKGNITPEMAVGHSLQHIAKLYEAQAAATADRRAEQTKIDGLEKRVHTHQAALDRLLAFMEKVPAKRKPTPPRQPKPDQP